MHAAPSRPLHPTLVLVSAGLFLSACVTDEPARRSARAKAPASSDVSAAALCQLVPEVEDAAARRQLIEARTGYELKADTSRVARFGAMMSHSDPADRFSAFHADELAHPASPAGPLGECLVYAEWKMADRAGPLCDRADKMLHGAAIVDVARARLASASGAHEQARAFLAGAATREPKCLAVTIEQARVTEAAGDAAGAIDVWGRALDQWPACFLCASERARIVEASQGKTAALAQWERALQLAPQHIETLRHYAALQAGVDDAAALKAYEAALAAGLDDFPTLIAAASLAKNDPDKAQGFAQRAVKKQPNDLDAWRLLLSIARKRSDAVVVASASKEVLRLAPDDAGAHLVQARAARADGRYSDAVEHMLAASASIAAGRTAGLDAADLKAAREEQDALFSELQIASTPATGKVEAVVGVVQGNVRKVFNERRHKKPGLKGSLDIAIRTTPAGMVDEISFDKDTLGDPQVQAAIVGNFRRAKISGGARRYTFSMEFR